MSKPLTCSSLQGLKLAVVGSRGFEDHQLLSRVLTEKHSSTPITTIVSGGARGADTLAETWASENDIPIIILKPDWGKYGRAAGIIRNKDIIGECDEVIAFWDGKSRGTRNSIEIAKSMGKSVKIVYFA